MSKYIKQDDVFELVRKGVLISNSNFESVCKHIGSLPTIDIVTCKDCKCSKVYQTDSSGVEGRFCEAFTQVRMVADDDFCSYGYGERKEE